MSQANPDSRTASLIRDARLRQALTDARLAARVGVSTRTVSRWENGQALPDLDLIRDDNDGPGPLAVHLKVAWEDLADARADDELDRRRTRLLGPEGACA